MAYADRGQPGGGKAGIAASLVAGPIFVASFLLAAEIASVGAAPAELDAQGVALFFGVLAIAIPFGFVIAIVPCVIVASLMTPLARRPGVGRLAPVWMIAGAAPIAPFALYTETAALETFALAATGALCALVARRVLLRQLPAYDRPLVL